MTKEHDWDPGSNFCRGCGASAHAVFDGDWPRECRAAPNVVAISHIVARRRMNALLGQMAACLTEPDGAA